MEYRNLTLLGTSHIAQQSIDAVKKAIENGKPDIIAIELDEKRLKTILSSKKSGRIRLRDIRKIGIKGYLFSLLGEWVERKLGEQVGVKPGTEMLTAVKLAKQQGKILALIDQPIEITLRRLNNAIGWKEKLQFGWDIIKNVFKREKVSFDLHTVPDEKIIKELTQRVKKDYPRVYHVLVEERNEYMVKKLVTIMREENEKKILAVIGAGHEKEMISMIKELLEVPAFSYSFSYEDE